MAALFSAPKRILSALNISKVEGRGREGVGGIGLPEFPAHGQVHT